MTTPSDRWSRATACAGACPAPRRGPHALTTTPWPSSPRTRRQAHRPRRVRARRPHGHRRGRRVRVRDGLPRPAASCDPPPRRDTTMTTTDLARTTEQPRPAALRSLVLRGDIAGPPRAEGSALPRDVPHPRPRPSDAAPLRTSSSRHGGAVRHPRRDLTALAAMHGLNREIIDGPRVMDPRVPSWSHAVCRATLPGGRYRDGPQPRCRSSTRSTCS